MKSQICYSGFWWGCFCAPHSSCLFRMECSALVVLYPLERTPNHATESKAGVQLSGLHRPRQHRVTLPSPSATSQPTTQPTDRRPTRHPSPTRLRRPLAQAPAHAPARPSPLRRLRRPVPHRRRHRCRSHHPTRPRRNPRRRKPAIPLPFLPQPQNRSAKPRLE